MGIRRQFCTGGYNNVVVPGSLTSSLVAACARAAVRQVTVSPRAMVAGKGATVGGGAQGRAVRG